MRTSAVVNADVRCQDLHTVCPSRRGQPVLLAVAAEPMVAVGFRPTVTALPGMDSEAVVCPVWWRRGRPAGGIPRRFDPVGGPPVLTPSSASDVREYLASSHAAMIAVAIRCASVLSASSGKPATHPAQVTQGPEPRKGMGLRAMRRRRSASLSALNLSRSLLSSEDGSSR